MDRNGYNESILQNELDVCFFFPSETCTGGKLDRHEVFGAAYRAKSKKYGLWVSICHCGCHTGKGSVHEDAKRANELKRYAQEKAMQHYGWTEEDFRKEFGRCYM